MSFSFRPGKSARRMISSFLSTMSNAGPTLCVSSTQRDHGHSAKNLSSIPFMPRGRRAIGLRCSPAEDSSLVASTPFPLPFRFPLGRLNPESAIVPRPKNKKPHRRLTTSGGASLALLSPVSDRREVCRRLPEQSQATPASQTCQACFLSLPSGRPSFSSVTPPIRS